MRTSREQDKRCGCGKHETGSHCQHCGFEGCWECALECAYSHQVIKGVRHATV